MRRHYFTVIVSLPLLGIDAFAPGPKRGGAVTLFNTVSIFTNAGRRFEEKVHGGLSTFPSSETDGTYFPEGTVEQRQQLPLPQTTMKLEFANKHTEVGTSDMRQLLGMPAATAANESTEKWKVRLQLTKPITWIPLAAGVMCGAAASGNYHWIWNPFDPNDRDILLGFEDAAKALVAMTLAGPFMEGYSQTINDWYDREIDAINEPYRPIPSGAITESEVLEQIWFLVLGSIGLACGLDVWAGHAFPIVLSIALFGTLVGYIYSAPPLKLKQNGWAGDLAIGFCYITLPWWCGQAAFGPLDRPVDWILPMMYSIAGIGPAIANDFKSIEGDREFGLNSIPVMYGVDSAKWMCAASQTLTQLGVAAYLYSIGEPLSATILFGLVLPQIYFQATLLLPDPIKNDMKYQAMTQPFFFFGILVTALCVGHHDWSAHL